MSYKLYDDADIQDIADAIREKNGLETTYKVRQMGDAIRAIGGGLSDEIKQALLDCFAHVAWVDEYGWTYYDALYDALYPPANLVSISCVYTQSGTVYDTDSLDSLKSDLVVTAHYDNQSTQTITTYTLSGTLTEGTSTITVSYLGKTTTFDVTVTDFGNRMSYVYTDGDLIKMKYASGWDSTHGAYLGYSSTDARRSFVIDVGVRPLRITSDNVTWTESSYYPIPIPSNATKVTVSITPSTQYHGEAFYVLSNGEYNKLSDPGWKQGSFTHTFTAGAYEYMTIGCKQTSAGGTYTVEPTEMVVQFATE